MMLEMQTQYSVMTEGWDEVGGGGEGHKGGDIYILMAESC